MKQVRNCQQVFSSFEYARRLLLCSEQLIQRIDWHELDSGYPVDLFLADDLKDFLHYAIRACIAVMVRILEQFASISQKRIVNTPGVHADPLQFCFVEFRERLSYFPPQPRNIPVQRTTVRYRLIWKSMDFLSPDCACMQMRQNSATAFSAKIEGQIGLGWPATRHKKRRSVRFVLPAPW